MNRKTKIIGDISIISIIIVFAICMYTVIYDFYFSECIVCLLTLVFSEMRHEHIRLRELEILDENKEDAV